ncbi:FeoB-associated Cys-rich membrane protein [Mangrovibacterium lignilyticum]|uniref:FeoB-associated Cys-rich membrane protein n=1 Tax=Mangrovibacterium lignilyticum TaxID=2668052 RepID=UPI0013D482AE|nr:FeoB-associated Cys-rich membrane protein [Mangrovibacterium lignilyticum]
MIQNIIVLVILAAVLIKVGYSTYKSLITKEKGLCGSCVSCDFKRELKKRGKLKPYSPNKLVSFRKEEIRFAPRQQ